MRGASATFSWNTLFAGLAFFAIVPARPALEIARAAMAAPTTMQREAVGLVVVVAVLIEPLLRCRRLLCTTSNK
jgi:hypothetical protein